MSWTQLPTKLDIKDAIFDFFETLPSNPEKAFESIHIKPHEGKTQQETITEILKSLWEDLEDWWEEIDDPGFDGPWLSHISPLREITTDTLGWDFSSDPNEAPTEDETILVNVHCFGEPTDDTARFELKKEANEYRLYLDSIHMM